MFVKDNEVCQPGHLATRRLVLLLIVEQSAVLGATNPHVHAHDGSRVTGARLETEEAWGLCVHRQ